MSYDQSSTSQAYMRLILPLQAIRDGVIEAVLDHEHGRMQSKENTDIYGTREPQLAFHQRIQVSTIAKIIWCCWCYCTKRIPLTLRLF